MESRLESRRHVELIVSLKGRDRTGESFIQEALASSISVCGALLSGIGREMRSGDLVWVEYAGRQARFKVVWVRYSESQQLTQAAVQLCGGENSPWKEKVSSQMKAVAQKKGQQRHPELAGFRDMGTLRCDVCGEEFVLSHPPGLLDKNTAERQAHWLEKVLAEEHERERKHADRIELPD